MLAIFIVPSTSPQLFSVPFHISSGTLSTPLLRLLTVAPWAMAASFTVPLLLNTVAALKLILLIVPSLLTTPVVFSSISVPIYPWLSSVPFHISTLFTEAVLPLMTVEPPPTVNVPVTSPPFVNVLPSSASTEPILPLLVIVPPWEETVPEISPLLVSIPLSRLISLLSVPLVLFERLPLSITEILSVLTVPSLPTLPETYMLLGDVMFSPSAVIRPSA